MKTNTSSNKLDFFCPAMRKNIAQGQCWEYCFANQGGPKDSTEELNNWIKQTELFKNINEFHEVCKTCPNCQWSS